MYLTFIHIGRYDIKVRRHLACVQNGITQLGDWRMETWQLAVRAHCHVSIRQSPSLCNAILNTCPCLLAIWLNGLYGLYGPRCPLSSKRPINLISLSLVISHNCNSTDPGACCWNLLASDYKVICRDSIKISSYSSRFWLHRLYGPWCSRKAVKFARSLHCSIDRSIDRSLAQSIHPSVNQSINQSI